MPSRGRDGLGDWLGLAAAPVLLVMTLLTAAPTAGHSMGDASPLGGMTTMYLLMALFHSPPWLKRIRRRSAGADRG